MHVVWSSIVYLLQLTGGARAAEALSRYQHFVTRQENPDLRECPGRPGAGGCGTMVAPSRTRLRKAIIPAMACGTCGHQFCYHHSNAHPGESCREYEQQQRAIEQEAAAALAAFTKPCPKCKSPTEKNSGCAYSEPTTTPPFAMPGNHDAQIRPTAVASACHCVW